MKNLRVRDLFSTSKREESVQKLRVALERYRSLLKKTEKVSISKEMEKLVTLQQLIREVHPETAQRVSFRLFKTQEKDPFLEEFLQMPQKSENPTEVMITNLRITNARIDDIESSSREVNSRIDRALEKIRGQIKGISEMISELGYRFGTNTIVIGLVGALVSAYSALEKGWIALGIGAGATLVASGVVEIKRRLNLHKKVEQILSENHEENCASIERALDADRHMHEYKVSRAQEGVVQMIDVLLLKVSEETVERVSARVHPIPRY